MPLRAPSSALPGYRKRPNLNKILLPSPGDPAFSSMRCLGCAAKTSHQVLQSAMRDAVTLAVQKGANLI